MEGSTGNQSEEVAVVTGGNRGIGLEICRQLASNGITVVLTARDEKRGAEAVNTLGLSNVVFHQLEVSDPLSAARLADFIKEKFGKLDILVNNAGIAGTTWSVDDPENFRQKLAGMDDLMERIETISKHITESYEEAEKCLRTNYHGIKAVTKALLPLLQSSSHGRIVNISSYYGLLRFFSGDELKEELNNIDSLSEQRLDELSELFLKDFKDGQLEPLGWPKKFTAYKVSKALMNAYSRILAKEHPSLCINCVHPGYVQTDMNLQAGDLPVEEGARGALMMAMAPKGGVTGAYLDKTEVASFV
ncbi:salutaridine reductase-like [Miscanthus floridulus]|uniref:salutaridine reductase-like n=1 Tax=Miscanthus floridulus TaxID=154761 RepID=UPI003459BC5B